MHNLRLSCPSCDRVLSFRGVNFVGSSTYNNSGFAEHEARAGPFLFSLKQAKSKEFEDFFNEINTKSTWTHQIRINMITMIQVVRLNLALEQSPNHKWYTDTVFVPGTVANYIYYFILFLTKSISVANLGAQKWREFDKKVGPNPSPNWRAP